MARKPKNVTKSLPGEPGMTGTVVRSTGSWYLLRLEDGQEVDARLRGKLRIKGIKTTNPIAVGDFVQVALDEKGEYNIHGILPRRNFVLRKSVNLAKRAHILCANIDQALIMFTIDQPVTTLGYVDRLLVICEAFQVPPVIVFNKIDVLKGDGLQKLNEYREMYAKAGYPVHCISAIDKSYTDEIRLLLQGKVSFLVGRSGSGKSATVNLAAPTLQLKVGEISDNTGRGKHTTTFAEMFELPFGGYIIDSPGFREMQIFDIEKAELANLFPEMRALSGECRFNNCIHVAEPGCAVKAALSAGKIPESRYHTYLGMLEEVGKDEW